MSRKYFVLVAIILVLAILITGELLVVKQLVCPSAPTQTPKAMMVLIEFQQTDGLVNMAKQMHTRGINGLLMLTPDFVDENLDVIKSVIDTGNVEIVPSYVQAPFWDIPYEEQYTIISDMITRIETALGIDVRIISSRYMASDENTIKVADELGIEYVMARGTTDLAATIYKPEEYDVKLLSVSNIDTPEFKYGSLCDYSYYERGGSPEDIRRDLDRAATNTKFTPVSHTYIGGYKQRWNDMWLSFWEEIEIDWVSLDELGSVDKEMPMWQIPINKNAPYTPEKIRPAIPYEDESNVNNLCSVEEL